MPYEEAIKFKNKLGENLNNKSNDFVDKGYVHKIEFNADYKEVNVDFTSDVSYQVKYEIIMFIAKDATTYQLFNGVGLEKLNLHMRVYQNGEFANENDFNMK